MEALAHPWILEGLPTQVLMLHYKMLGIEVPEGAEHSQEQPLGEIEEDSRHGRPYNNESSAYQSENDRPSNMLDGLDYEDGDDYTDLIAQ